MHHGASCFFAIDAPYTPLGGYIAKVDGRTEYQSVGPGNLFQNGSQCILELADVRCFVFKFADHI